MTDFGWKREEFQGVVITCRYMAPGLTFSDLYHIYYEAEKDFKEGSDDLAGNPGKWRGARGVKAVTEAIVAAMEKIAKCPS